eukprot:scaffold1784_cov196-Alexandrium_tamarense.AAC.3
MMIGCNTNPSCSQLFTLMAFNIIATPSSSAGTLYIPNASCGIVNPLDGIARTVSSVVMLLVEAVVVTP